MIQLQLLILETNEWSVSTILSVSGISLCLMLEGRAKDPYLWYIQLRVNLSFFFISHQRVKKMEDRDHISAALLLVGVSIYWCKSLWPSQIFLAPVSSVLK